MVTGETPTRATGIKVLRKKIRPVIIVVRKSHMSAILNRVRDSLLSWDHRQFGLVVNRHPRTKASEAANCSGRLGSERLSEEK
jgi:hypothetical protein